MIIEEKNKITRNDKEIVTGSKFVETTISGYVMVTKNPCSHPGDIRLLKAVGEDDERYE